MKNLSKPSIVGLLALICLAIIIPVTLFMMQQQQELRQRASELTQSIMPSTSGNILIAGYVYKDTNKNGEREQNEPPIHDIHIQITQAKNTTHKSDVTTDTQGYFKYQLPWGKANQSFFVKIQVPAGYTITTTNPLLFSDIKPGSKEIIEFGLFADTTSLEVSPTATASAVPNCTTRPACLDATPRCLLNEPSNGWCPKVKTSPTSKLCKKVLTLARNTKTNVCQTFKSSCLPEGWAIDKNCQELPTPS